MVSFTARLGLEITARWKVDEVKGPDESVNKGAVVGYKSWGKGLENLRLGRLYCLVYRCKDNINTFVISVGLTSL